MVQLILLGEAWGKEEEAEGKPFVGSAGYILNTMLSQVGISRSECHVTNVFNFRPQPSNDVKNLCGPKAEGIPGLPPLIKGKYVNAQYAPELDRLYRELAFHKPNLVVALGATAAWAMLGTTGIRAIRGAPLLGRDNIKVLPTYHPAAIMRDWSLRPITLSDLAKASREQHFPDLRRPQRFIHTAPSLGDLAAFERDYIDPSRDLSIDIETIGTQITEIGFAPSVDRCLVVPFYDRTQTDGNYWRSLHDELAAWAWVRRQCAKPHTKVFQNGLYDMHFTWRQYGIRMNVEKNDDTMLMHHAEQPEMEKGLGFLGSVYTDEAAWKFMREKHETAKRED